MTLQEHPVIGQRLEQVFKERHDEFVRYCVSLDVSADDAEAIVTATYEAVAKLQPQGEIATFADDQYKLHDTIRWRSRATAEFEELDKALTALTKSWMKFAIYEYHRQGRKVQRAAATLEELAKSAAQQQNGAEFSLIETIIMIENVLGQLTQEARASLLAGRLPDPKDMYHDRLVNLAGFTPDERMFYRFYIENPEAAQKDFEPMRQPWVTRLKKAMFKKIMILFQYDDSVVQPRNSSTKTAVKADQGRCIGEPSFGRKAANEEKTYASD